MHEKASFRDQRLTTIAANIADADHLSGGGTAAAISGSMASALTAMIARLSAKRRANREALPEIEAMIDDLEGLIAEFQHKADVDAAALASLMAAYPKRRTDPGAYVRELENAAESTLALGEDVDRLLHLIERLVPYANRFTVSDLGAAAAMARGVLTTALLTAEVNVLLIQESADPNVDTDALARRLRELRDSGAAIADRVEQQTREWITGKSE